MKLSHEEWLAERKLGIGGSDAHHVLNEPPYGCARRLWYDKTGQEPDYPKEELDIFKRGTIMEEIVCDLYTERTGRSIRRVNTAYVHPKYPFIRANIDRQVIKTGGRPWVLEAKTMGREVFHRTKRDGLPTYIILQMQHNLLATGYNKGSFAILWPDGFKDLHFDVDRDDELIAIMLAADEKFWKQVENGPAPDQLDPNDKRCQRCIFRNTCQGQTLLAKVKVDEGTPVLVEPKLDDLVLELVKYEDIVTEAKELADSVRDKMKEIIGDNPIVECEGYRFYYKPQTRILFKTSALKKDHPELFEKYSYESVTRPFTKFPK